MISQPTDGLKRVKKNLSHNSDGDQDHRPGLLLQQAGIRRGVLANDHVGGWWRAGVSGPGNMGQTPALELSVGTLPRAITDKNGPYHQRTPPYLHPGALNILGGSPYTLPGPIYHSVRGPERRHRPIPEPAQSSGC